jgi:AraC-like DNA-binding protein
MNYREHAPHPALAAFVECFWSAADPGGASAGAAETILPDGCPEWIFHFGAPYRSLEPDGSARLQGGSFLVGTLTHPLALAPTGPVHTMGVRFRPGGASAFLSEPLSELTDAAAPTVDLFGNGGRRVEDDARNAPDDASRRAVLERFLLSRLASRRPGRRDLDLAVAWILAGGGAVSIGAVAERLGKSRRQLERAFARGVGVSPKTLARIVRFQNLLRRSTRPGGAWSDLAAECGFADQAHLIREFREFSRATPSRPPEGGDLSLHFVAPERLDRMFEPDVAFLQDGGAGGV